MTRYHSVFNIFRIAAILISLVASGVAFAQSRPMSSAADITAQATAALMRKDYPEALRLNLKAAELGNAQAQTNLGAMFQDGAGVERNYREAMKWYQMAARAGNVQAEKNIGDLYIDMSVPEMCRDRQTGAVSHGCFWMRDRDSPNEIEALKWYLRAAEKGHPGAMTNLARLFALGHGAKQDCAAARRWLNKAANAGNQAALENIRSGVWGCENRP